MTQEALREPQEMTELFRVERSATMRADVVQRLDEEFAQDLGQLADSESPESKIDEALDSLKLYLQEINRYPLLRPEEERRLGQQIAEAAAEHRKPEPLQQKQVIARGEVAARQLANANLRLVVSIARGYKPYRLSVLDLIQEGNCGLMRAVHKYDHTKGYRFSTYATWWIRHAIGKALVETDRTIRLPDHAIDTLQHLRRVSQYLVQELGHEPTADEIACEMGLPVEKVYDLLNAAASPISLNLPVGDEHHEAELSDFIPARQPDPAEEATNHVLRKHIREVLATLPRRDQEVLELRFGLKDGRSRTLAELGREFHVTRSRIQQIERRAIRWLRDPSRLRLLKGILQ